MKKERVGFDQSIAWLVNHYHILPETTYRTTTTDYIGPYPLHLAKFFQSCLTEDRLEYLLDRMLTAETIKYNWIGYRPDYNAYTFPFWSGTPGESEIEALQYRAAPGSTSTKKYWGEKGHYKGSVLNRHLINPYFNVFLFGTVDAQQAAQDGLPALSTNGVTTFTSLNRPEAYWLQREMLDTKCKMVVLDATVVEFEPAHRFAELIGAEVRFFPRNLMVDEGIKDYNDYRRSGRSVTDFIQEILGMNGWHDERLYAVVEQHIPLVMEMLDKIGSGEGQAAFETMQAMVAEARYGYGCIQQSMMMAAVTYGPRGSLNSDEWKQMIAHLDMVGEEDAETGYRQIAWVIQEYSSIAQSKMGAF